MGMNNTGYRKLGYGSIALDISQNRVSRIAQSV